MFSKGLATTNMASKRVEWPDMLNCEESKRKKQKQKWHVLTNLCIKYRI